MNHQRKLIGIIVGSLMVLICWFSFVENEWRLLLECSTYLAGSGAAYKCIPHSSSFLFNTCPLKLPDPFDPEHLKVFRSSPDPVEGCVKVPPATSLNKGNISYHPNRTDVTCEARCILLENYGENDVLNIGEFSDIKTSHYPCDTVEVVCKDEKNTTVHEDLLKQIYEYERDRKTVFGDMFRSTNAPKITDGNFHPNVFVIIVDSISVTSGIRGFSKTLQFLREHHESVAFNFISKVGKNSKPNALALMMGKIPETIDRSVFGEKTIIEENTEELCNKRLDDQEMIMYLFEDAGYKTMFGQNSIALTFNYDGCVGITSQLATHYFGANNKYRVHQSDTSYERWEAFKNDKCNTGTTNLIDYNELFIRAYAGTPKMSFIWDSWLGHDSEEAVPHGDKDILRFLKNNQNVLQDSFVIFMGDHGLRFGKAARTKQGLYNSNNPMMHISLPKRLRGSQMHEVIKKQSMLLASHHDTHATFLDIVKYQPLSNFTDTEFKKIDGSLGSSFLRDFEKGKPRNCKTLPIPPHYCLCNYEKAEAPDDVKKAVAETAVSELNKFIKENSDGVVCAEYKLNEVKSISTTTQHRYPNAFQVVISTIPKAFFGAEVGEAKNGKLEMITRNWSRLDEYGSTSNCLPKDQKRVLKELCFCKSAINTTTESEN